MLLKILCLISSHFYFVNCYTFETPLAETLYPGKCKKNSHLLNDCNWCYCNDRAQFMCDARLCDQVDLFAHFKDNVQELHVGMEGHGAWRSNLEGNYSSCQPKMRYIKESTTCICSDSGTWPNKVCDQLFQVLYEVQITGVAHPNTNMYCNHTKLYLIGCNACFCPKEGRIDPELCTNKTCTDDDPALLANRGESATRRSFSLPFKSLYATCTTNQEYKIGCRTCKCIENNTLNCGDCKSEIKLKKSRHICYGHRRYTFIDECNICFCGDSDFAMCTTKNCYNDKEAQEVESLIGLPGTISTEFVKSPDHDKDCVPGTKYLKKCNVCHCMEFKGVKIIDCQIDTCNNSASVAEAISSYCVPGTFYEVDCLYCRCFRYRDIVWQRCAVNRACIITIDDVKTTTEVPLSFSVNNGISDDEDSEDMVLEVIRMFDEENPKCETETAYKLDCNYCICLSNGNSMCTFFKCK